MWKPLLRWSGLVIFLAGLATSGCSSGSNSDERPKTSTAGSKRTIARARAETLLARQARSARRRAAAIAPAVPGADAGQGLVLSRGRGTPATMGRFMTYVLDDVDTYWRRTFRAADLPPPQVKHRWLVPGEQVATGCITLDGSPEIADDNTASYCPLTDTIFVSQKFASDLWAGLALRLPNYQARELGDFGVASVLAHEYAHNVQHELGAFSLFGDTIPVKGFELHADCMAGTWANSVYHEGRLEPGDFEEAMNTASEVGDFSIRADHHGTPAERQYAWKLGYDSGAPRSCGRFLARENMELPTENERVAVTTQK